MKVALIDGVFKHVRESTGEVITVDRNFIVTPPGVHIKELLKGSDKDFYYELNNACAGYKEDLERELAQLRYEASFENETMIKTKVEHMIVIKSEVLDDDENELLQNQVDNFEIIQRRLNVGFKNNLQQILNKLTENGHVRQTIEDVIPGKLTEIQNSLDEEDFNIAQTKLGEVLDLLQNPEFGIKLGKNGDFITNIIRTLNPDPANNEGRLRMLLERYSSGFLIDGYSQLAQQLYLLRDYVKSMPHIDDILSSRSHDSDWFWDFYNDMVKNYYFNFALFILCRVINWIKKPGIFGARYQQNEGLKNVIHQFREQRTIAGVRPGIPVNDLVDRWNAAAHGIPDLQILDPHQVENLTAEYVNNAILQGNVGEELTYPAADDRLRIVGGGKKYERLTTKINSMIYIGAILFILIFIMLIVITVKDSNTEFKISYSRKIPKP